MSIGFENSQYKADFKIRIDAIIDLPDYAQRFIVLEHRTHPAPEATLALWLDEEVWIEETS